MQESLNNILNGSKEVFVDEEEASEEATSE